MKDIGILCRLMAEEIIKAGDFLPYGILAGLIILFLMPFAMRFRLLRKRWIELGTIRRRVIWLMALFLLTVYVTALLYRVFFIREIGSRHGIVLIPFSTFTTITRKAEFILNILMFLPMGVLLPIVYKGCEKFWKCVLIGFFSSICIELTQLFLQIGFTEVDDVITNTCGCAVGWILWKCGYIIILRIINE